MLCNVIFKEKALAHYSFRTAGEPAESDTNSVHATKDRSIFVSIYLSCFKSLWLVIAWKQIFLGTITCIFATTDTILMLVSSNSQI